MKRIIAKSTLRNFGEDHADAEQYLKTWYDTAKSAKIIETHLSGWK
jgi:mRNA interferase HigB